MTVKALDWLFDVIARIMCYAIKIKKHSVFGNMLEHETNSSSARF